MDVTLVKIGTQRVPMIRIPGVGGELLRPAPVAGRSLVEAALKAATDEVLGIPPVYRRPALTVRWQEPPRGMVGGHQSHRPAGQH